MDMDNEYHEVHKSQDAMRWIPVVVSLYSAFFTTFVLYPWHMKLSNEFIALQETCFHKTN